MDTTGDPWNGRTLEWSTTSPPPVYNFAVIPEAENRDAFWAAKKANKPIAEPEYEDIVMPKNTGMAIVIASFAFLFGFAVIWHIWWLVMLALLGAIVSVIVRLTDEDTEYKISAAKVRKMEAKA